MANWGRALQGLGQDLGNIVAQKQREKEMQWEEARAIRLENLRAKNNAASDKARHGYRMEENKAASAERSSLADKKHKWDVAAAKLERDSRADINDRNYEQKRREALNKIRKEEEEALNKITAAVKGNQEFESSGEAAASLGVDPSGDSQMAEMLASMGGTSAPKGKWMLTEDAATILRSRIKDGASVRRAAWEIEDKKDYDAFIGAVEENGSVSGATQALQYAVKGEMDKARESFKHQREYNKGYTQPGKDAFLPGTGPTMGDTPVQQPQVEKSEIGTVAPAGPAPVEPGQGFIDPGYASGTTGNPPQEERGTEYGSATTGSKALSLEKISPSFLAQRGAEARAGR